MVTLDRIRLTGLLRKSPAQVGLFYVLGRTRRVIPGLLPEVGAGGQRCAPRSREIARAASPTAVASADWRAFPVSRSDGPATPIPPTTEPSRPKIGAATPISPRTAS